MKERLWLCSLRRGYWSWCQRRHQSATWTQALVLWKGVFVSVHICAYCLLMANSNHLHSQFDSGSLRGSWGASWGV